MKQPGAGQNPQDFFGAMFGESGKGPQKTKSVIHPIKCTLGDLYNGKSSRIKVNRDRLCEVCNGKGGEQGDNQKCEICRGSGKIMRTQHIGMGQMKEVLEDCYVCFGSGEYQPDLNQCNTCKGKKVLK